MLFNHTSYMDAVVIGSGAAGPACFHRQEGIRRQLLHPTLMQRVGVASSTLRASASLPRRDVADMARKDGCSCSSPKALHAPRRLLGFYMAAFKWRRMRTCGRAGDLARRAHAAARRPMVPASHVGQRRDRAADQAFRHPDFGAMLCWRDAARAAMLKHVGDPIWAA